MALGRSTREHDHAFASRIGPAQARRDEALAVGVFADELVAARTTQFTSAHQRRRLAEAVEVRMTATLCGMVQLKPAKPMARRAHGIARLAWVHLNRQVARIRSRDGDARPRS